MSRIIAVLLAAGSARRFGAHKLLASTANGEAVGVAAARSLCQVGIDCVAVTRPGDAELARRLGDFGMRIVENGSADDGMAGSIATGVRATADADGWIIALADMPYVRPSTVGAVLQTMRAGAILAAPSFHGRRGHPVGFAAPYRDRLMALHGDEGARVLLRWAAADLVLLPTEDRGVLLDIDRPADLGAGEAAIAAPRQP